MNSLQSGVLRRSVSNFVLDASALLALLHRESGAEVVQRVMGEAVLSTVNWSEVLKKAIEQRVATEGLREDLEALGLEIVDFNLVQADLAAQLWKQTKAWGLSLGDRACLALALESGATALTTDRVWQELSLSISIQVIR